MEEASRFRVVTEIENDDVLIVFARELQNEITRPYLAQAFDDKRFIPGASSSIQEASHKLCVSNP